MIRNLANNERIFIYLLFQKWGPPGLSENWGDNIKKAQKVIDNLIDDGVVGNEEEEKKETKKTFLLLTKGVKKLRERQFESLWMNYGPKFITKKNIGEK